MIKELFPLRTFQQDAVLKRLSELADKALSEEDIEGGTIENAKPLYWHTCKFYKSVESDLSYLIYLVVINNSPTPLIRDDMFNLLLTPGFVGMAHNSKCADENGYVMNREICIVKPARNENEDFCVEVYLSNLSTTEVIGLTFANSSFEELGVNKIN